MAVGKAPGQVLGAICFINRLERGKKDLKVLHNEIVHPVSTQVGR